MKNQQFVLNFLHNKVKRGAYSESTIPELESILRKELVGEAPFKVEDLSKMFHMRNVGRTKGTTLRNLRIAGIKGQDFYSSNDLEEAYLSCMKSILRKEMVVFIDSLKPKYPVTGAYVCTGLYYKSQKDLFGRTSFPIDLVTRFFFEPKKYLKRSAATKSHKDRRDYLGHSVH